MSDPLRPDGPGRIDRVPVTGVLTAPVDPLELQAWHRALRRVEGVEHPHLAPLQSVEVTDRAVTLTHLLPAGWVTLEAVLAEVTALSAGQIVTVGVPVAQAIAALHRDGEVGLEVLTPDDVVVDPSGRPELVARRVRPLRRGDEAADVGALATLLRDLLADGAAPAALAMVLLRACDPDDPSAASASGFATALLHAHRPTPLWGRRTGRSAPVASDAHADATTLVDPTSVAGLAVGAPVGGDPTVGGQADGGPADGGAAGAGGVLTPAAPADTAPVDARLPERRDPVRRLRAAARGESVPGGSAAGEPPAASSRARRRVRHRRRPRLLTAAVAVAVVLAAALSGAAWAAGSRGAARSLAAPASTTSPAIDPMTQAPTTQAPTTQAPTTQVAVRPSGSAPVAATSPPDWRALLTALDRARVAAFVAGDPTALSLVDGPGSPAWRADADAVRALVAAGVRPVGLRADIVSVAVVRAGGQRTAMRVVDRRSAYRLVDRTGRVVATTPARGRRAWVVTVVREATGEWRVSTVRPVGGRP